MPDRKLFLFPELSQHIVLFCHGAKPFLVLWNHALGNVPLHRHLIAVLKMGGPIQTALFAAPVYLAFPRVQVYLIDAQIVHTEGMENIIAPLLQLPEQIPPF